MEFRDSFDLEAITSKCDISDQISKIELVNIKVIKLNLEFIFNYYFCDIFASSFLNNACHFIFSEWVYKSDASKEFHRREFA